MPNGASAFSSGVLFYVLTAAPQGLICKGAGRSEHLALFEGYICAWPDDYQMVTIKIIEDFQWNSVRILFVLVPSCLVGGNRKENWTSVTVQ